MKRVSFLLLAVLLILTLSLPGSALAQSGSPTWNSIIYYYNPGTTSGTLGVTFVNTGLGTTPAGIDGVGVGAHAFGLVSVGSTGDYKGAATLSADVPLVAVYKQFDAGGGAYAPVLYSSFDATQSSTTGTVYVPSVLHAGYYVSKVGIQNVETEAVSLTLTFFDASGSPKATLQKSLASQGAFIFQIVDDADNVPGIPSSFDGSLVIKATKVNGGGAARVVAAVEDLQSQGQRSYAYEGSSATSKTFNLPYANCHYSTNQQSTTFFVQNAGSSPATINVFYYTTAGAGITYYTPAAKIVPGARMAVSACDSKVFAKMNGKNGTARITSDQPLVVVGKATSTDGLSTAFTGQPAGSVHVLLPYIPYKKLSSGERATLSIMNVGAAAAKNVYINYYYQKADKSSFAPQKVVIATATATLAKYGKYTATPKVNGAALDANGDYLGAAEVISDQPVVVIVRVTQNVTGIPGIITLGEDYTGVPCGTGCQ
jgi:hypothetical protein